MKLRMLLASVAVVIVMCTVEMSAVKHEVWNATPYRITGTMVQEACADNDFDIASGKTKEIDVAGCMVTGVKGTVKDVLIMGGKEDQDLNTGTANAMATDGKQIWVAYGPVNNGKFYIRKVYRN